MGIKGFYVLLSGACLLAAMVEHGPRRFAWAFFAFMFLLGADKIKDAEKLARKVRMETANHMKAEMLEGYEKSLDDRNDAIVKNIGETANTLLKQLATHIVDISPTRAHVSFNEKEHEHD